MQTFNSLEFAVALTIVAKASGISAQGQERWRSGFHTRHGRGRLRFRGFRSGDLRRNRSNPASEAGQTPLVFAI